MGLEARHVTRSRGRPNRGETSLFNRSLRSRRALLLAGSCCSALIVAILPSQALAQTANQPAQDQQPDTAPAPGDANATQPEDQNTIVVTGFRRSLQDSINIKRNERGTVEAVSAEEIGKLPDVSIAESIAGLPGIAAQRVAGRAEIVSIRGFSPDFTTVLLNGRQQASSGFNRAVEFDQYPSELMGSVVVYRFPTPAFRAWGLPARLIFGPFDHFNMASAPSRLTCAVSWTKVADATPTFPNLAAGEASAISTRTRAGRSAG